MRISIRVRPFVYPFIRRIRMSDRLSVYPSIRLYGLALFSDVDTQLCKKLRLSFL